MRKKVTLVTGAAGEVGTSLVQSLAEAGDRTLLTLDLTPLSYELSDEHTHIQGDILDEGLLARLVAQYEIETIFHLAALLSTRAEFTPETAHRVNVEGTLALLKLASDQSQWRGRSVQFIFPSSIAVYGLPTPEAKGRFSRVREWEWTNPTTMYGCNKRYCELLGRYLSHHYKQLSAEEPVMIDFRSVRFPGLISAMTVPSGGTSDYAPEMLHAAAQGEPYHCFVEPHVRIPFMVMPDATHALIQLAATPKKSLSKLVYNVTSFSLSAEEIRDVVVAAFPDAQIDFEPDMKRQAIVETWPADLDDTAASQDWKWHPQYDQERSFNGYLIPNIKKRYSS
jgi:nucleoside-diphosphate-sugar epimerase